MAAKNRNFAAGLADAIESPGDQPRSSRLGMGVLAGRGNRLAELATGTLVNRAVELIDPARCRMWHGHNRDYAALSEERCRDLIDSLKAQGKQEVPALVRRIRDDPDHDFEVISGARRHWSVSWLRSHNYPDFRFLVEIRELTDEEAFRLSDIENRAREDISDYERARDYLRALDAYYGGKQLEMAERIHVSTSWLSRYLDLARLPSDITGAFASPHDLGIKHVTQIKPLLKPEDRRDRVLSEGRRLAQARADGESVPQAPADVVRLLALAADAPKKTGTPKKTGKAPSAVTGTSGAEVMRIDKQGRKGVTITLLPRGGATRFEAEEALRELLDRVWPASPD
ncbi:MULTISPECIES: ParB/RepB/Spo0J family partition protein [Sphingomonas]|jgi:ParB family chromosome partitioning protein|uniref:ParB/RepB/Spo0J family partition protein n=1 Tax=Sphingomonas aracearum TaxID=2283317 RepID=A0A369VQS4_9SPHN|nr:MULTISPECIES: ParB/RepB/Spo0J family partition protein [Sphingomonas]MCH4894324.1 ParB/RepB/Spo0J family partition protein [Sphingomonas sp. SFZ2018-12]RDE04229.1 ParB/RepB/Spo0J family partition protein [Sphingomonas aracearum]